MTAPDGWTAREIAAFRRKLVAWSTRTPREMPWRGVADPYRVWISEIMLQQTTVAAVVPYYQRFMARFPDLASLAAASEQDVLAAWEGLGYYSRGRNLHRAAQAIVSQHQGQFPRTAAELQNLPGIGRYTAGAIASFAFDLPAPILEANTQRVYARLLAYAADPRTTDGQTRLWGFAAALVPAAGAGPFNQALIDLGALVCTPVAPRCPECPVKSLCRAFREGRQGKIPPPKPRQKPTEVHELAVAVRRGGRWLVRQRQATERWAGMWDFPRLSLKESPSPSQLPGNSVLKDLHAATGLVTGAIAALPPFSHSVTRYRIRLSRVVVDYQSGSWRPPDAVQWLTLEELAHQPMPMAARRFVKDLLAGGWDPDAAGLVRSAGPRSLTGRQKRPR